MARYVLVETKRRGPYAAILDILICAMIGRGERISLLLRREQAELLADLVRWFLSKERESDVREVEE